MAQTRQQRIDEIIKSDPFYSGDDTHLDLSAFPALTSLDDASFEDELFAPLDRTGSGGGAKDLKKFISDQMAEQSAEQHGPSTVHVGQSRFRVTFQGGVWNADGEVDGQRHRYTASDREALLGKLATMARQTTIRELTQSQRLEIIRLCQGGQKHHAIDLYIRYAIGHRHYADDAAMLADPALLPILNRIADETWFYSEPDAPNSAEWHSFKEQFAAGRPLTHDLLDSAYEKFKRTPRLLAATPEEEPDPREIVDDLNSMTDEEIDRTYAATVRASNDAYRRRN
jgi:hypothetical protein